jgi:hypothetical protein
MWFRIVDSVAPLTGWSFAASPPERQPGLSLALGQPGIQFLDIHQQMSNIEWGNTQ